MELSKSGGCQHPDIRRLQALRCCLSCGFTLALPISVFEIALSAYDLERKLGIDYCYKALNYQLGQEIRLLILKPGNYSESIECEIVHANLLDKPRYEAISYTWVDENGDDAPSGQIICARSKCFIHICQSEVRAQVKNEKSVS